MQLHEDADALCAAIAGERTDGAAITTATNDDACELNALIRENRAREGDVDDARTVDGIDGLPIGRGDLIVAADLGDAREQFTTALERDRADRGLREATERARATVAVIVADGPVRLVNAERARLTERIEDAEKQAAWWSKAATRLDLQADEQRATYEKQQAKLAASALLGARSSIHSVPSRIGKSSPRSRYFRPSSRRP